MTSRWLFSVMLCSIINATTSIAKQTEITLFSIANVNDTPAGKSIIGGHQLAIQEINNNTQLLPNYQLKLEVLDAYADDQQAVIHALNITSQYNNKNNNKYIFPIVLGAQWSSLSASISPILNAYNMGQMSSAATSIAFSKKSTKYPHFYRTIPSDSLQAQGILLLCDHFKWTEIAVIYADDNYGLYFSLEIQSLATKSQFNIDVTSIAVSEDVGDYLTYQEAGQQIKEMKLYIIVCILHDAYIDNLFTEFKRQNITQYPYFFIGLNWLDDAVIKENDITSIAAGSVGTQPWQPMKMPITTYDDEDVKAVFEESMARYESIHDPDLNNHMIYAYDAMYVLAYAMQEIEENSSNYTNLSLLDLFEDKDNTEEFIDVLNEIILDKTDFIGASGHILFDDNGDRLEGLYSFGNVLEDGSVDCFGYFYEDDEGEIVYELNESMIIWPREFEERGIIPQSGILIHKEYMRITNAASITVLVLSGFSIIVALFCIIMSIWYRKEKIMCATSWRLNIVLCVGAILAYIRAMMYCISETYLEDTQYEQSILNISCNLRIWVSSICFTLIFMPLFAKTYRLSKIFDAVLRKRAITDLKLFIFIGICVLIDIIILGVLTYIKPLKRYHITGDDEIIDPIQKVCYIYSTCAFDEQDYFGRYFWIFYGTIIAWKVCQSLWGLHVILNLSKLKSNKSVINQLLNFEETGVIFFSVLFTVVVIAISVPIFVYGILNQHMMLHYVVMVAAILINCNVIVCINLLPRIVAVLLGKTDKFKRSPSQMMEHHVKKELKRLGWVQATDGAWSGSRPNTQSFTFTPSKFTRRKRSGSKKRTDSDPSSRYTRSSGIVELEQSKNRSVGGGDKLGKDYSKGKMCVLDMSHENKNEEEEQEIDDRERSSVKDYVYDERKDENKLLVGDEDEESGTGCEDGNNDMEQMWNEQIEEMEKK